MFAIYMNGSRISNFFDSKVEAYNTMEEMYNKINGIKSPLGYNSFATFDGKEVHNYEIDAR